MSTLMFSAVLAIASMTATAAEPNEPGAPAAAPTATLSTGESIGQLMLVTLQGLYGPNNDDRIIMKNFTPGGVLLPLAAQPRQVAEYVQELHKNKLEATRGVPLLIGADIYSLTRYNSKVEGSFVQLPSLMSMAGAADVPATERLANLIADHFSVMGFNLNMGPSLCLAPTLDDADSGMSTFGADPEFAGAAGTAMVRTFKERGIIALPLGFPGGGANRKKDEPATLLTPKGQLDQQDLLPYKQVIDAGTPILHVGNTLVPALDKEMRPASLSPVIMRDLLRTQWGYKGVIVAGPMDAPEIERLYSPPEAAVMALLAGADMLYWSRPGEQVRKAMERIAAAVEDGTMPLDVIQNALLRILEMKTANLNKPSQLDPAQAEKLAKRSKYAEESYEIERRAITLVKNDGDLLPLSKQKSLPLGVTGVVGVSELQEALEEYMKPVMQQPIRSALRLGDVEDFEIARLTTGSGMRTAVCVLTDMKRMQGQMRLIRELKKKGMAVVVVALGDPRNIAYYAEADAILAAYCEPAQFNSSIRAIADILAGNCPVRISESSKELRVQAGQLQKFDIGKVIKGPAGKLPTAAGDAFPAGTGLTYASEGLVKKAEWDFGDGDKAKGPLVEHTYATPGVYTLSINVTTPKGDECSGSFKIRAE